ncbi:hypothetical protein VP01_1553g2 [Puccinia sorghi]|uniref:Uncharacterized protein n=1 Tax=Puccinia sorghi TaxID=27349 RepID=A0A0L6VI59_9BASI|nr:hypothetical protein VP01_1553g2 [Puccinia sorghi]
MIMVFLLHILLFYLETIINYFLLLLWLLVFPLFLIIYLGFNLYMRRSKLSLSLRLKKIQDHPKSGIAPEDSSLEGNFRFKSLPAVSTQCNRCFSTWFHAPQQGVDWLFRGIKYTKSTIRNQLIIQKFNSSLMIRSYLIPPVCNTAFNPLKHNILLDFYWSSVLAVWDQSEYLKKKLPTFYDMWVKNGFKGLNVNRAIEGEIFNLPIVGYWLKSLNSMSSIALSLSSFSFFFPCVCSPCFCLPHYIPPHSKSSSLNHPTPYLTSIPCHSTQSISTKTTQYQSVLNLVRMKHNHSTLIFFFIIFPTDVPVFFHCPSRLLNHSRYDLNCFFCLSFYLVLVSNYSFFFSSGAVEVLSAMLTAKSNIYVQKERSTSLCQQWMESCIRCRKKTECGVRQRKRVKFGGPARSASNSPRTCQSSRHFDLRAAPVLVGKTCRFFFLHFLWHVSSSCYVYQGIGLNQTYPHAMYSLNFPSPPYPLQTHLRTDISLFPRIIWKTNICISTLSDLKIVEFINGSSSNSFFLDRKEPSRAFPGLLPVCPHASCSQAKAQTCKPRLLRGCFVPSGGGDWVKLVSGSRVGWQSFHRRTSRGVFLENTSAKRYQTRLAPHFLCKSLHPERTLLGFCTELPRNFLNSTQLSPPPPVRSPPFPPAPSRNNVQLSPPRRQTRKGFENNSQDSVYIQFEFSLTFSPTP